jgi:hypothetical protein
LVDLSTGRPRGIPGEMASLFELMPGEPDCRSHQSPL